MGDHPVAWVASSSSSSYQPYPASNQVHHVNQQQQHYLGTSTSNSPQTFDDEPPLLEELGIDLGGILKKTRSILLHRLNNRLLDDLDFGGALVFILVLAGLHLLMGKMHFGVILGWSVVHSAVLWFILNQLAGGTEAAESKGLDLYYVCCVVGYSMVPLVVYSAVSLLLPRGAGTGALALCCTLWSAHTAAKILVRKTAGLDMWLVMYPCTLLYAAFAALCVY